VFPKEGKALGLTVGGTDEEVDLLFANLHSVGEELDPANEAVRVCSLGDNLDRFTGGELI